MLAVVPEEPARALSGGMYVPLSRNDLMFDMRKSEEAEGESKIIGSGRRLGFFGRLTIEEWARGTVVEGLPLRDEGGGARERARKISADLRMWEKS